MPTPDASQFTQLKRYVAIEGDAARSAGSKISPFNTFYTRIPSAAVSNTTFLPSANRNLKQPLPTITNLVYSTINGDTYELLWDSTDATSTEAVCITDPGDISVPEAISLLSDSKCRITNQLGSIKKGPYNVTITVRNSVGSASATIDLSYPLPTISTPNVGLIDNNTITVTWTETNATSRTALCTNGVSIPVNITSGLVNGSVLVTNDGSGPYNLTITVINAQGNTPSSTVAVVF